MAENKTYNDSPTFIPARLESSVYGLNPVADAKDIYDINHVKWQKDINDEIEAVPAEIERIDGELGNRYTKEEVDSKVSGAVNTEKQRAEGVEAGLRESIDELGTIGLDPENAISTDGDDFDGDTLEKRSKIPTIGSVLDGADEEPSAGSEKLVRSGGVESSIFSSHGKDLFVSEVKTKASGTGSVEKSATTVGIILEKSRTYILKLTQAASLSGLYLYIIKNGETVKGIGMTVGKNYIVSDIDADSVAFYSATSGTTNGQITMEVSNTACGLEKIVSSDVAARVLLSEIQVYEGFSGNRAFDVNIKRGQRFRLITKAYDSAAGKITIYAKNSSDTLWTQTFNTINNDIELCLDENVTTITYWINETNVSAEGLFVLAVSLDDGNVQFDRNKVNALMHLDVSENIDYSGDISEASTRHQVGYNKGDMIRVAITSKDYSEGTFYVYLKDKNGSTVYFSNLGVNSTTDIVVPADLGTISWYVNSAQIVIPGVIDVSVYKLSSAETIGVSDNMLYGPYKEVKVSGTTGYVHEDVLNVSCQEGDVFFVGFEKVVGNLSVPIVCYFKDENNVNVNVVYVGFPQEIKAPAGTKSLIVRLYPNQTGTAQDITAVYYNIYVAKGTKAKKYIYEDTTPVYAPNDYYHEDNYLNDKVARINELLKANYGYGDAFIFITDTHWMRYNAKQSPSLIRYIREHTNITKLIGGGDFEDQGVTEGGGYNMLRLLTDNFKENDTHVVVGNHEFLGSTTNSQIANLYNKVARHQDLYNGSLLRWYYFYDDNFRKIRYIFLASYDESERVKQDDPTKSGAATDGYDSTQLTWLENTALANVPDGYDIIVIAHGGMGIMQDHDHNEEVNWSAEQPVAEILDSYKSAHPNCHILNIRGHVHRDRIAYTEGGLPFVLVTCDKNVPWPSESDRENPQSPYYQWYPDLNVDRETGTINEQAFDVMILNTHTHTLTAVRIGGKARNGVDNNAGDEVEERVVSY